MRALRIAATSNDLTGNKRVTFIARYTLAVSPVSGRVAFREPSTGVFNKTWVDTFSVEAHLSVPTLIVVLASNRLTGNERVSNVSRRTSADRPVVLDKTLSIGSTITWILTLSIDAGFSLRAVIVSSTARRIGQFNWNTGGVCGRHPTFPTGADHCSKGETINYSTYGSDMAGGESDTRVLAPLVKTGSVVRTVAVKPTLWFRFRDCRGFLW